MNEEQLWWTVLSIFSSLFFSDFGKIPNINKKQISGISKNSEKILGRIGNMCRNIFPLYVSRKKVVQFVPISRTVPIHYAVSWCLVVGCLALVGSGLVCCDRLQMAELRSLCVDYMTQHLGV